VLSEHGQRAPLILTNTKAGLSERENDGLQGDWVGVLAGNTSILVSLDAHRAARTAETAAKQFHYKVDGKRISITDSNGTYVATNWGDRMNSLRDGKNFLDIVKAQAPAK